MVATINKKEFANKLNALFERLSQIYSDHYKHGGFKRPKNRYEIQDDATMTSEHIEAIDYNLNISMLWSRLSETTEFQDFRALLRRDKNILYAVENFVPLGGGLRRYTEDMLITRILELLFRASIEGDPLPFDEIYEAIVEFYGKNNIPVTGRVYLDNVKPPPLPLNIDKDIIFKELSQAELITLLNSDPRFERRYGFNDYSWSRTGHVIEFSFEEKRITVPENETADYRPPVLSEIDIIKRVQFLLDAIRIFSQGIIITSSIFIDHRYSPFDSWTETIPLPHSELQFSGPVTITENELNLILDCYRLFSKTKLNSVERIALDRLKTYEVRQSVADKIIDLFIGFEALVLGYIGKSKETQGELRFRVALLTAKYLGEHPSEQEEIYDLMMKGYSLRSDIVHGNKPASSIDHNQLDKLAGIFIKLIRKWVDEKRDDDHVHFKKLLFWK